MKKLMNEKVNPRFIRLLESEWGKKTLGRQFAVIRYRGRKSQRERVLVAAYKREGGEIVFRVGAAKGKSWWRNFRGGHEAQLLVQGEEFQVRLEASERTKSVEVRGAL